MPSSFHGINTMSSALAALQRSIDVTGSNIANVNTKGYARRRVDLQAVPEQKFMGSGRLLHLGSGVSVSAITRARDVLVERSASKAMSDQGRLGTLVKGLEGIDAAYGEPRSDGISAGLNRLFDSFSSLAANPGGQAQRVEVRSAVISLSERIQTAAQDLASLESAAKEEGGEAFARIHDLVKQIAALNQEITSSGPNASPNELLDSRQRAVEELSGLVKIEVFEQGNGALTVQAAGEVLVDQSLTGRLPDLFDPSSASFDPAKAGALRGGSLLGAAQALEAIRDHRQGLDELANEVRAAFNSLHETGVNLKGGTGISLFAAGTGASDLKASADVLASPDAIASGVSGKTGDGGLAQALADLRDSARAGLGGKTLSGFFSSMVTRGASDAQRAAGDLETENLVAQQIEAQRQAVSGVNLDEEFAQMIQLQRSYQAAARALNVFDQITEDLLGILR